MSAFRQAQVYLSPIWNYDPNIFLNIPQMASENHCSNAGENQIFTQIDLRNCQTNLEDHQYIALKLIMKNKSTEHNQINNLWSHSDNNWIRNTGAPSNLQLKATHGFSRLGSILANDMGLGKTSSTLALILGIKLMARRFQIMNQDGQLVPSAATLVICSLATLSNWEDEIKIHFHDQALPYQKFHEQCRQKISREDLLSSLVVLTTYAMIGATGNPLNMNNTTIESLNIFWYRIVLDEAQ
ncbi:hypothetical protein MJO29_016589 [Puccinia striiformis f. sp. tritici]|nr:hypothetical protein MJO29_016589 [Puccinia striiformis f. sp. tritici]